jgi:1-deoxy-D-xylulose-5-phosphate reductoisomerase
MIKKNIVILGSTGSIGESALDIVRQYKNRFRVVGLAVSANIEKLKKQIKEFNPLFVSVACLEKAQELKKGFKGATKILSGRDGLCALTSFKDVDLVLIGIVGVEAIYPLLSAIRAKKTIALANKESIVIAGDLVRREVRENKVCLIPIDSEQNAIFQCLEGRSRLDVERIYLTASGGPLWNHTKGQLRRVALKETLAHPRWKMGKKITVDSATLMNKGLEVIEARELFDIELERIKVLVHRQALIHSMVEFVDGSILAQMAVTDMRLPIQIALTYPERWPNDRLRLDPLKIEALSFEAPDNKKFPCLELAYEAARLGGTGPCVLNAANEVAVSAFLENKLAFTRIPCVIEKTLKKNKYSSGTITLEAIFKADAWARQEAKVWTEFYRRKD